MQQIKQDANKKVPSQRQFRLLVFKPTNGVGWQGTAAGRRVGRGGCRGSAGGGRIVAFLVAWSVGEAPLVTRSSTMRQRWPRENAPSIAFFVP